MHRWSVLAASFVLVVATLPAQSKDADDAVRSTHAALVEARAALRELAGKPGLPDPSQFGSAEEFRAHLEAERKRKASPEHRARMAEARQLVEARTTTFLAAFRGADWSTFDAAKDGTLLHDGLLPIAEDARSPKEAVAACKQFLRLYGDDPKARQLRAGTLPLALLSAGDVGEAVKEVERAIVSGSADPARLTVLRGDLFAASGDVTMALKSYEEAAALCKDPGILRPRLDLVGRPAPEIDSKAWIGAEARPLSALVGKVVVLKFWATFQEPCRALLPALDAMHRAHHGDGLAVLGITRRFEIGYLPADAGQLLRGGASLRGLTDATFGEHLAAFRTNAGIASPFVVASIADHDAYRIGPRSGPRVWVVVVARDGKIALLVDESGRDALVQYAVKSLLGPGAPKK